MSKTHPLDLRGKFLQVAGMKTAALDSAFGALYHFAPETNKGDKVACNAALFMVSERWTDSQPKAAKQFVVRAPSDTCGQGEQ